MLAAAKDLGPILDFVSFALFIVLLGLYVRRTLEMRRLVRLAPFLANQNGQREPSQAASRRAYRRVRH